MSAKENQVSAPEYSATTIDMSYSPPYQEAASTAAESPSNVAAKSYTLLAEGNYQQQPQAAGWNPPVFPSPPPYYGAGNQPQPVLVSQVLSTSHLQDRPGLSVCPFCQQQCMTSIEYKSGCLTILLCCLLFFFGCVLGCFLIPCCVNSCKDVTHYCPNCKHPIYTYRRL